MTPRIIMVSLILGLCCAGGQVYAQPSERGQSRNPNEAETRDRQTARERQELYLRYFREICESGQRCDDRCNEVFARIENKASLRRQCQ
jgi:hypothetical protein